MGVGADPLVSSKPYPVHREAHPDHLFANQVPNPRLSAYTWSAANEWKNTASEAGAAAR